MDAAGATVADHGGADHRPSGHRAHVRLPAAVGTGRRLALFPQPGALCRLRLVAVVPEPGSAASRRLVEGLIHAHQPDPDRAARRYDDLRPVAVALLPDPLAAARPAGAAD